MPEFPVINPSGASAGTVSGPDHLFGIAPNVPVMHQVVTAQLAAARQGTHDTQTRSDVTGGAKKPWAQKGTGRGRQGSTVAPSWRGGGVAWGPKPRSYAQRTPKKMIRLALASALSDRAAEGRVRILDDFGIAAPKTKDAVKLLGNIDVWGNILVVVGNDDAAAAKSFANLVGVQTISHDQLNTYDVIVNDFIVFTKASFEATCTARPAPEVRKAARVAAALATATSSSSTASEASEQA